MASLIAPFRRLLLVRSMLRYLAALVLALSALGCVEAAAGTVRDERNVEELLKYLRPVLKPVGGAARIYYGGTCNFKGDLSPFPRLKLQPPSKGARGLIALRQIVQNDRRVTVTKKPFGMIRIYIGESPSQILQTNIRSLKLKPDEQYTPWLAIHAIENTPEVQAAIKPGEDAVEKLGGGLVVVSSILVQSPVVGFPHVAARQINLTLDQALDSVAKAFGAIIIYDEWKGPRGALQTSIDFQPVADYSP